MKCENTSHLEFLAGGSFLFFSSGDREKGEPKGPGPAKIPPSGPRQEEEREVGAEVGVTWNVYSPSQGFCRWRARPAIMCQTGMLQAPRPPRGLGPARLSSSTRARKMA